METGVFSALAAEPRPFNSTELAEKTGVDKGLLSMLLISSFWSRNINIPSERLLRYYQAIDVVSQIDDDTYQSSNVTRALSNDDHAKTLQWT